eukprot:Anaeramoba_ignava/c21581_g1_i1.p1 GENE.c21581_g1_i1~~c21581_g1_i1.p1  ORF type:complete len:1334 (+),score=351.32 c21581_g1_i1:1841-5842(+)
MFPSTSKPRAKNVQTLSIWILKIDMLFSTIASSCAASSTRKLSAEQRTVFFYILLRDYSNTFAAKCMSRLSRLTSRFLAELGFSIGISDVQPSEDLLEKKEKIINTGYQKCENYIEQFNSGTLVITPGMSDEETLESQISSVLSDIRDDTGKMCMKELSMYNAPLIMSTCGSKGSPINISQMVVCVGQQSVSGARVPDGFETRSLPHFPIIQSKDPAAKGFVANSFFSGLSPTEFFFHTMAGREGLIDTAVKTADTGYMQRRLVKSLEDLTVQYDRTVRNAKREIVQFIFGDDGLDPCMIEKDNLPLDFLRMKNNIFHMFPSPDEESMLPFQLIEMVNLVMNSHPFREKVFSSNVDSRAHHHQHRHHHQHNINISNKNIQVQTSDEIGDTNQKPQIPKFDYNKFVQNNFKFKSISDNVSCVSKISPLFKQKFVQWISENLISPLIKFRKQFKLPTFESRQEWEKWNQNPMNEKELQEYNEKMQIVNNIIRITKSQFQKFFLNVLKRYKKARIDPGTAVGALCAQSIGEPGTQMSLPGNESVIISFNGNISLVEIGHFIDSLLKKYKNYTTKLPNNSFVFNFPKSFHNKFQVLSLGNNQKIAWKPLSQISKHSPNGNLLQVKTSTGRIIQTTFSHSFVVRKNNQIVPQAGKYLKIGDKIPIISKITKSKSFSKCKKTPLLSQLSSLLGCFLSIGKFDNSNNLLFKFNDPFLSSQFSTDFNFFNQNHSFIQYQNESFIINSEYWVSLLKNYFKHKNLHKKQMNCQIFNNSNQIIQNFLHFYIRYSQGYKFIYKDQNEIYFVPCSSNKNAQLLSLLFLRLGIFTIKQRNFGLFFSISTLNGKKPKSLHLIFNSFHTKTKITKNEKNFAQKINHFKTETDRIPGFDNKLFNKMKSEIQKINRKKKHENNGNETISRTDLSKIISSFEKQKTLTKEEMNILKESYEGDVVWDSIIEMKSIDSPTEYVYDFAVPEFENFITGEGIVTHNTLKTFHFAGVASMNITQGVPRIKEIINATANISTPIITAELLNNTSLTSARHVRGLIESVTLGEISEKIEEVQNPRSTFIRIVIDEKLIQDLYLNLDIEYIAEKILRHSKLKLSPKAVRVESANSLTIEPITSLKTTSRSSEDMFFFLQHIKNSIADIVVAGVPNITRAIVQEYKEKDQKFNRIVCEGTNLLGVMGVPGIDFKKTTSNHIIEMYNTLGIEAGRSSIFNEIITTMEHHGISLDLRHVKLLADLMTLKGSISGITRFGIRKLKDSVFMLASFENTSDHLFEAAIRGTKEKIDGVSESIILGIPIPLGTGLFKLIHQVERPKYSTKPANLLLGHKTFHHQLYI